MARLSLWSRAVESTRAAARRSRLLRWTLRMAVLLMVLGCAGLFVLVSGIVPIKASSGHFPMTHAMLHFAKQRSVATHTIGMTPPPLDDPALIMKGAGHYEIGCRPCHGSPELHHPRIAHRMLPPPPYLPETAPHWKSQELFYMVKHGIKFTGMPAWPASQRDDEVWAMVAFLRAFPQLSPDAYHDLVNGRSPASTTASPLAGLEPEPSTGGSIAGSTKTCNPCHGPSGQGRDLPAFPKLAGQQAEYFVASMEAFARGERHSGIMEPIAAGLSSKQLRDLARHFAQLKSTASDISDNETSIGRGELIARQGIPKQEVPACADCHDPGGAPMNPLYPSLAGQHADYLVLQLTLFQENRRGGTSQAHLMRNAAAGLNAEQIRDIANYFATQSRKASRQ